MCFDALYVSAVATKKCYFFISLYLGVKQTKKALNKQKSNNARIKYLDRNVDDIDKYELLIFK